MSMVNDICDEICDDDVVELTLALEKVLPFGLSMANAVAQDLCSMGFGLKEVVRCAECTVPHNMYTGCPRLGGLVTPPDFYCAYGEKEIEHHCDHCGKKLDNERDYVNAHIEFIDVDDMDLCRDCARELDKLIHTFLKRG